MPQYVAARAANQVEVQLLRYRYQQPYVEPVQTVARPQSTSGHGITTLIFVIFDGLVEQFLKKDGIGIVDTGSNTLFH